MNDTLPPCCEDCGTTTNLRAYTDPETEERVLLCPRCAAGLLDEPDEPEGDEEPYDDEFADACFTAADYMRADEGC
ncbi:MAG: hypothetical protein IT186_07880 [Acidobacteria bacterium]|nr:MAG: hypothetical protein EDX89_04605 [Acidobacteriota bacterium]MCC6129834.1 hypothetical protein [Acidobacteriota bacterium]MCE7957134.1 hypothetical protein [Acidobacteria bacterium ACB2]